MRRFVFIFVLFFLAASGCDVKKKPQFTDEQMALIPLPPKSGLPSVSGGFVISVGNEPISSEEIVAPLVEGFRPTARTNNFEQFCAKAAPDVERMIINKVSNIILYQKAEKGAGTNIEEALEKAVESEMRKFLISFNNDYARAEHALREMKLNWESFREYQKKMILSQSYISSKMPDEKHVTYNEMLNRYNELKERLYVVNGSIAFSLIDIQIDKMENDPNVTQTQAAYDLAAEVKQKLEAGVDFGELARQYSHGHRAMFGGKWNSVNPESLASPYDTLAKMAQETEVGKIAESFDAPGHIFIMKLEDKTIKRVEPFEDVQKEIASKIVFERRKEAVDDLSRNLVNEAGLGDRSEFIKFCLHKLYVVCSQ